MKYKLLFHFSSLLFSILNFCLLRIKFRILKNFLEQIQFPGRKILLCTFLISKRNLPEHGQAIPIQESPSHSVRMKKEFILWCNVFSYASNLF